MLSHNYNYIREKLSNSSCVLDCTFNFDVSNNIIDLPIKSNASIVNHNNHNFGLVNSEGIIIKNISKKYIPSSNLEIIEKFSNNQLNIKTQNQENPFFSYIHIYDDITCITTNKYIYIYNDLHFINQFSILVDHYRS